MASKYGSKYDDGNGGAASEKESEVGSPPAIINVTAIRVDEDAPAGGTVPLDASLRLEIDFDSDTALSRARWNVKFVVDIVSKRYIVALGSQNDFDVCAGHNSFVFSIDSLDVTRVRNKHLLNNAGLLVASLVTREDQDVIDVNLVVQTSKSKSDEKLVRYIMNPLR